MMEYSTSQLLETMPHIFSQEGELSYPFKEWYVDVVKAIYEEDVVKLHKLSDNVMPLDDFKKYYMSCIGNRIHEILTDNQPNRFKLTNELDIDIFSKISRNILGAFLLVSVETKAVDFSMISDHSANGVFVTTSKLFFTYRAGRFNLISAFTPFTSIED